MNRTSWTDVFSSLPDTAFFEVVRHYLGPVQTPFHKPDLIGRMDVFFKHKSVHERVLSFIDTDDARFLSIVGFLGGVSGQRLSGMVPDFKYVQFREKLLNLEERLLIWSRPAGKARHYALTPLGDSVMESGILGPGCVLGEGMETDRSAAMSWFDDNFLTCALAFLSEGNLLFRKEGGWRKKALEYLEQRFPLLFRDDRGEDRLLLAGRGLIAAGLARRQDEKLLPVIPLWREYEALEPAVRIRLLRARAAVGRTVPLDRAVSAVRVISECLPTGRAHTQDALASLFQLALGSSTLSPLGARHAITHLELMGVLQSDENGLLYRNTNGLPENDDSLLSITPVGDISIRPGSPLFCDLALATLPERLDVVAGFRMDKSRFQAGLDMGATREGLQDGVAARSGRPLPPNIMTLCSEWESEHRELNLRHCVVLQVEGVRREIIETTGILDPWTFARPADGYWLLDPADEPSWREALAGVGIERIPPVITPSGLRMETPTGAALSVNSLISWLPSDAEPEICSHSWKKYTGNDIGAVLQELRKSASSASLSPEETQAFTERLERRVILVPEQIRKGAWRFEVMSAKGLDYRGKIRLAEAAMSGRDERLAVTIAVGNDIENILVLPQKLEKDGDDHVLVALSLPDEEEVRYKIRKIGLLKRIKASLF